MSYIYLEALIEELENMDQDAIVRFGFGKPMSYRGYYDELAFEPVENAKISDMLDHARSALNETFEGYKGGEYTMTGDTNCYIAEYGCGGGDMIGPTLINYWKSTKEEKS